MCIIYDMLQQYDQPYSVAIHAFKMRHFLECYISETACRKILCLWFEGETNPWSWYAYKMVIINYSLANTVLITVGIISLCNIFSPTLIYVLICCYKHYQNVPACGSKSCWSQAPSKGIHQTRAEEHFHPHSSILSIAPRQCKYINT